MQSDLPHTLYKRNKKDAGKKAEAGKNTPVNADDPAFAMQKEAYERKLARLKAQADGDASFTLEEIFRK